VEVEGPPAAKQRQRGQMKGALGDRNG
jgi:hypothetical protein